MSTTDGYHELYLMATGQHALIRVLLAELTSPGGQPRQTLDDLRASLAAHEAWEQGWVHPLAAARVDEGQGHPGDVDNRLLEERDTGIMVDRLHAMRGNSPAFHLQCALLAEAVTQHARDEEQRELPLLAHPHHHRPPIPGLGRAIWVGGYVPDVTRQITPVATRTNLVHAIATARLQLEDLSGILAWRIPA